MSGRDDRLLDLLAQQATEGLDVVARAELDGFCRAEAVGIGSLEQAAAAAELALAPPAERMPEAVRERVAARLRTELEEEREQTAEASRPPLATVTPLVPRGADAPPPRTARAAQSGRWGWLAAAAALVLAVLGWWPRTDVVEVGPAGLPPTVVEKRERLLETDPEAVQLAWTPTEYSAAAGAGGDLVWSNARQTGYMRFEGLPPNDPSESQYQLWIFDASQDERFPIDGGVFDVPADGEVVVPIDPKISVDSPQLFAVTIEKPGGVVVSDRERIVLVAART